MSWLKRWMIVGFAAGTLHACGSEKSGGDGAPPPSSENGDSKGTYACLEGLKESLAGSTVKVWEYGPESAKYCGTGRAMAIAKDQKGNIYIGGRFNFIGDIKVKNLAMYNPESGKWSALGAGIEIPKEMGELVYDNPVEGLLVAGNTLYVTGSFEKAGDVVTTDIAKWNIESQTWSAMPHCVRHGKDERLVADSAGNLYSTSGCKWDGTSWSITHSSVDRYAPVAIKNDEVYTSVDGQLQKLNTANGSWTNNTNGFLEWTGSGFDSHLAAIAPGLSSEVYVAGTFIKVGDVPALNVAKWDGSKWSALGDGIDKDEVKSIAVHSSGVYFSTRWDWGGVNSSMHKWDGSKMVRITLPGMLKDRVAPAAMLTVGDDLWLVGNDGIVVKAPFDQFQVYQK